MSAASKLLISTTVLVRRTLRLGLQIQFVTRRSRLFHGLSSHSRYLLRQLYSSLLPLSTPLSCPKSINSSFFLFPPNSRRMKHSTIFLRSGRFCTTRIVLCGVTDVGGGPKTCTVLSSRLSRLFLCTSSYEDDCLLPPFCSQIICFEDQYRLQI